MSQKNCLTLMMEESRCDTSWQPLRRQQRPGLVAATASPAGGSGQKHGWMAVLTMVIISHLMTSATCSSGQESSSSSPEKAEACLARVRTVVAANSPELLVLPNEDEISSFTTSRLHVNVDWTHIDALINANGDKWCVGTYLVEYGTHHYERYKRESVASRSEISPSLGRDATSYTMVLEDNCRVYSVHLVVIPSVVVKSNSDLITSSRRRFWPAAYRTILDVFSDSAVVSWPPSCSYATIDWQLEACIDGTDEEELRKDPFRCETVSLNGDPTVHIPNLKPCRLYRFRLKVRDDLLWTFSAARTLPTPQIEARPRTNEIHITIQQDGECDDKALVNFWRISYCAETLKHQEVDTVNPPPADFDEGSGAGDGALGEDDDYFTYYDEQQASSSLTTSSCVNNLHQITSRRGEIVIKDLEECTLYSIDVSPADPNGHALQPGEQIGSVHSTLCSDKKGAKGDQESSFWFSDTDRDVSDVDILTKDPEAGGGSSSGSGSEGDRGEGGAQMSGLYLALIIFGSILGFLILGMASCYAILSICNAKRFDHHHHHHHHQSSSSSGSGKPLFGNCISNVQHFLVRSKSTNHEQIIDSPHLCNTMESSASCSSSSTTTDCHCCQTAADERGDDVAQCRSSQSLLCTGRRRSNCDTNGGGNGNAGKATTTARKVLLISDDANDSTESFLVFKDNEPDFN